MAGRKYNSKGFYIVSRGIMESDIVGYPTAFLVFSFLISAASFYEDLDAPIRHRGRRISCKVGQLVISPLDLGKRLHLGVNTVRRALIFLHARGSIVRDIANDGELVTIPNYEKYQNTQTYRQRADPKWITALSCDTPGDPKRISERIQNGSPQQPERGSKTDHIKPTNNLNHVSAVCQNLPPAGSKAGKKGVRRRAADAIEKRRAELKAQARALVEKEKAGTVFKCDLAT